MYTTINDAYAAFVELFGSEHCPWDRDAFQVWMQTYGTTRYAEITDEDMDAAYAACIKEITESGYSSLMTYDTAEYLREATQAEIEEAKIARRHDGGRGVIRVASDTDPRGYIDCYVE